MLSLNIKEPSKTINILVDGDDYLYSGDVLDILYEKYINTNCLITYGSHLSSKGIQGKKYPSLMLILGKRMKRIQIEFGLEGAQK